MYRPQIAPKDLSKKKDLEIVYNLQWKSKTGNGGGEKANIVGMYDIPATTLNWDVFKSYLLKNSGITDVKVSYITSENREFPIESQTDFQIALYAFRRKAMMGEIINLKLDPISKCDSGSSDSFRSEKPSTSAKCKSSDAETQFDCSVCEPVSLACSSIQQDSPPEWFLNYMVQFKKEIIDETTSKVSTMISNIKPPSTSQPSCYHSRKSKSELSKRRKCPPLHIDTTPNDKEAQRPSKHEKWEEKQLEKLRSKAMKIVEKKLSVMASKSSDSDSGHQQRVAAKMDARPLTPQSVIPHMLGGEIYLHTWEVENTGSVAWNHKTTLNFSWGSKELKATDAAIAVPHLKPRETGVISVRIAVPYEPGLYEGYWHFKHGGVRFGEWLGCQLIVDEFNLKGNKSVLEMDMDLTPKKFKTLGLGDVNPAEVVKTYDIGEPIETFQEPIKAGLCCSGAFKYEILKNMPFNLVKDKHLENENRNLGNENRNLRNEDRYLGSEDKIAPKNEFFIKREEDALCSGDFKSQEKFSSLFKCREMPLNLEKLNQGKDLPKVEHSEGKFDVGEAQNTTKDVLDNLVRDVSARIDDLKLQEPTDNDTNCSSDSDNLSVNSVSSNASSFRDEFVVVPTPECFKLESPTQIKSISPLPELQLNMPLADEEKSKSEENFDDNNNTEEIKDVSLESADGSADLVVEEVAGQAEMVMVTLPDKKDEEDKGYAFIMVDGVAIPIPKEILKEEYLKQSKSAGKNEIENEESVSSSSSSVEIMNMPADESRDALDEEMSHCSAAGSCFSTATGDSRLFVFPQACPGYEIVNSCRIEEESHQKSEKSNQGNEKSNQKSGKSNQECGNPSSFANSANLAPSAPPTSEVLFPHIPNYQQSPPIGRAGPAPEATPKVAANPPEMQVNEGYEAYMGVPYVQNGRGQENAQAVHILPETLVTGAVNVASSAINTARSVINMIKPKEPGRWVNGHWVSASAESTREANLRALAEMGFWDRDLNATLLARYNDDLNRVVSELVM